MNKKLIVKIQRIIELEEKKNAISELIETYNDNYPSIPDKINQIDFCPGGMKYET